MRVGDNDLRRLMPYFAVPLARIDASWPERVPLILAHVDRLTERINPMVHLSKLDMLTIVNMRRARMDHWSASYN